VAVRALHMLLQAGTDQERAVFAPDMLPQVLTSEVLCTLDMLHTLCTRCRRC